MTSRQPHRQATAHLGRVLSFDGVRAVAVLMVMAVHSHIGGFAGGQAGVDVFFVLSGFLITVLLIEERVGNGRIRLGAFYMRRVLRLYPALVAATVLALTLVAIRTAFLDESTAIRRSTFQIAPFALAYTANIPRALGLTWGGGYLGHTWSLSIEEQFYLLWPVVVIVAMRRRVNPAVVGWIACGCAVTSAAVRAGFDLAGFDSEMLYNATFSHVDGIFAGCALGVLWVLRPSIVARFAHRALTALAVVVAAIVVIDGQNMNEYGFAVVVVATLIVLCDLLTRPTSRLSAAMSHKAMVAIGRRSYGLYLYHWPIFFFIRIGPQPDLLALGFGASFAAAWLSYAFVETPFLRMKDRWSTAVPRAVGPGVRADR